MNKNMRYIYTVVVCRHFAAVIDALACAAVN